MKIDFSATDEKYVSKVERRLLKTSIVETFTQPEPDDVIIMGTFSRTWRNKPMREVLEGKTVNVNGRHDTPIAHTRDYISYCYSRRPCKREQRDMLKIKRMPLYSKPCIMHNAVYIDVKSAWFSIVNLAGWDVEYWPGRWLGRGTKPHDFPMPYNKVARSAMVTIGRTTALPIWKAGKMTSQRLYNATENYHIWGVIADTLNAIGSFAVRCGARYVNTDGFILHRDRVDTLTAYIEEWGLRVVTKYEGAAIICGPGSYVIGGHISKRVMRFTACDFIDRTVNAPFLRSRLVP